MEPQEIQEQAEHAHYAGQRDIGLTTSIVAVLLAIATLLGHRAHTEEAVLVDRATDQWNYYQAKKNRANTWEGNAELAKEVQEIREMLLQMGAKTRSGSLQAKINARSEGTSTANTSSEKGKELTPADMAKRSAKYDADAEEIQKEARKIEAEEALVTRRADYFDLSELFLEISIIFCSIALLTEMRVFWKVSFVTTVVGVAIIVTGFLLH